MFVRKTKLCELLFKTITETARQCGRNLNERQKNAIYLKICKDVGNIKKGNKLPPVKNV